MKQIRVSDYIAAVPAIVLLIILIASPARAVEYAKIGTSTCLTTIIPTLFPFFVVSSFFIKSSASAVLGSVLTPLTKRLFSISGECSMAPILGFIGGYPVGAKTVAKLYSEKRCTISEAEYMLLYCNNCGPAFILVMAGVFLLDSTAAGFILLAIHILTAVLIGYVFRKKQNNISCSSTKTRSKSLNIAFTEAVNQSVNQTLAVCGYVIFFSVLIGFLPFTGNLKTILCVFLEISNGITSLSVSGLNTPLLAAAASLCLGWGGLSVHFQTLSITAPLGIKCKKYFLGKALHGVLAAIFTYFVFSLIPVSLTVFRTDTTPSVSAQQLSGAAAVCCILIILIYAILYLKQLGNKQG